MADPLGAVLDIFADVMGERAPRGAETVPDDLEMWTSLTHVHLIHEVESRFGIMLPEKYLLQHGSLADLAAAVRSLGA
ncbi:acyl carrier protein [Streptomyces sp. DSM 41014]|uniref:Acyl carrier protein n=1 Tax=Streptomyces hintoniae TaxID=3075521 RepID=A0ABU2USL8_9ACTN|nr:acyl carrier protein [Streptomyces sp. DSM 41014]MDT0476276.1 acyl carrier protein [Streptomyces sp. DSM 41014]